MRKLENSATLNIILAIIGSGILTTIINRIFSVIDKKNEKDNATVTGLRTLLMIDIRRLGEEYLSQGEISKDDLEDIINLWGVYHDKMGGNGYLDNIMAKVKALPIKT